jgi:nucleoside-diphosphate-sugar epimerase
VSRAERVLVVGCGYVGTALAMRLVGEGHLVWGLRRDPRKLPTSVTGVEGDVRVPNTLRNLPDVDWIYYLVGPERDTEEGWRVSAFEGLRYFLGAMAAQRVKVRRFVLGSCAVVYGDRDGAWVDEDSAPSPSGFRAEHLLAGEALVRGAKLRTTIVRLGELYGPERPGLLAEALAGRAQIAPAAHANLLHRDDAAGVLAHVLAIGKRAAPLYVAVDRAPAPRVEVLGWLATAAGRDMPTLGGGPAEGESRFSDARCMSERLVEDGYRFRYPTYKEGYATLVSRPVR